MIVYACVSVCELLCWCELVIVLSLWIHMADSVILSPTRQMHLICTTVTCVSKCVCVCAHMVSGIEILTVFQIREEETSERYCKRSTSCLISKKSLSLFLSNTHTQKSWQAKFASISLRSLLSIFLPSLSIILSLSLSFSNKHRSAPEDSQCSAEERKQCVWLRTQEQNCKTEAKICP